MTDRPTYLFGIDLDGTLLSPKGEVTARTRAAIHSVLQAGHRVCFATGRNAIEAEPVFEAVGHREIVVLVSGAMVIDLHTDTLLHRWPMSAALAADLCGSLERSGHAAVAFQDRRETGVDYLVSQDRELHVALSMWLENGQRVERRMQMDKQDHTHTLRVSTVIDRSAAPELRSAINAEFGKRIYLHGITVAMMGVEILEMFDPGVNKWKALTRVADEYGIPHERVITVGDDTNDLPMIRQATLGLAMGNARADVKAAAKQVLGTNADDGLAIFLETWLAAM